MKIRKTFQGTIPENKILDTYSTSQTDTYSCNQVNKLGTYSATEQRIGTWTNGKPLYRKTLTKTASTNTSSATTLFTLSTAVPNANVVWLDESACFMYVLNQYLGINWYYTSTDYMRVWINKQNDAIYAKGTSLSDIQFTITLLYTKTTD